MPKPVANFTLSPTAGTTPLLVQFTDTSTKHPTSWSWSFGDGSTSTQQNPSHIYSLAGNYTVTLTATNASGSNTKVVTNCVSVSPPVVQPPVADFSLSPSSGSAPLTVQFTDLSTGATSWSWAFGDGQTSTVENPSHQYAAGTYSVTLTVTNSAGSNSKTLTNCVQATTPTPGTLPELVEWWSLTESSAGSSPVMRAGSMPIAGSVNPPRINLQDPDNTASAAGLSGNQAASFSQSAPSDYLAADVLPYSPFTGGVGSWTAFARVYFDTLPSQEAALFNYGSGFCWELYLLNNHHFAFDSLAARTGAWTTLQSTVVVQAGHWYSVVGGYDAASGQLFIVVVDDAGTLTRNTVAVSRRQCSNYCPLGVGGRGVSACLNGRMTQASYYKAALTDFQVQWLHNSGALRSFADVSVLPSVDPGPAPWTNITSQADFDTTANVGIAGLYWYRPYPLIAWNPTLAAQLGNYVWAVSPDHGGSVSGAWLGYSSSPAIRPTSWSHVINGGGIISGRTTVDLQTPYLVYVPSDANGRPFYCYGHCSESSGFPSGLGSSQETFLWTSADLVNWTSEGVCIQTAAHNPLPYNHTGYAKIYPPSELPGQTDWRAYHLATDFASVEMCTQSSNPKSFTVGTDPEELDFTSPFPAGVFGLGWDDNVFSPDGVKVYGLGRSYLPGGRGVAMAELSFENGAWRLPTGKWWQFGPLDSGDFPTLGYTQDARVYLDKTTRILHVYRLRGFYPQSNDERIDYYTCQM